MLGKQAAAPTIHTPPPYYTASFRTKYLAMDPTSAVTSTVISPPLINVEDLHIALQQSFSPDPNIRGPSEELIKHLKYVPGATVMLLQVTAEKQVNIYVIYHVNQENK